MSVETILVFGEGDESGPSGLTLELLAAARDLATKVEVFVAGDGAAMAAELGSHGASTVYSTGPIDGKLMGVHAAATLQAHLESNSADAIFFGQTPDGRDTAARTPRDGLSGLGAVRQSLSAGHPHKAKLELSWLFFLGQNRSRYEVAAYPCYRYKKLQLHQ